MKFSQIYAPTLRETPAEAEVVSHQLMLRAGMIRKAAGGIYSYLPLAWRTLKKIEQIVREEMNVQGGQELLMPIVQPAEMWQESGRWAVYGDEMFRLTDRHDRNFCLGPTHEEMITTLVRSDVKSYRQLPILLYQIQNKYRDEIRPRFGLMRGREFIMKDLYSFDKDENGLDISYKKMYDAYTNVFTRCGLEFRPVEADSGAIGGSGSHEFMVIADSGEAEIVYCSACDYAANVEKAELLSLNEISTENILPIEEKYTPNCKSITDICNFLHVDKQQTIKSIAFETDQGPVLALVRGDHEVNEIKVLNKLKLININMASEKSIIDVYQSAPGFIGPCKLPKNIKIIADVNVMNLKNAVAGANTADYHLLNINPGRDFEVDVVADIRLIQENDPCPRCTMPVKKARGIEVGQVFKLFTKYSSVLKATYLDENGKEKPMVMGCYGIGVSRTMAAAIEQNYDEHGIIWPAPIAPYQVVVIPVNSKNSEQVQLAEFICQQLNSQGIDSVWDDRNERAGVKFKDADLIGYPIKITIGPKSISEQMIEVKERKTGQIHFFSTSDFLEKVIQLLQKL